MTDTEKETHVVGTPTAEDEARAEAHGAGVGVIKPFYDDRLANEDLAPLKKQTWTSYNIFAFWMSDVHRVGGYVTAGRSSRSASRPGRCWWR